MIPVPLEFKELCKQFQLASLSRHGSVEAMIASTLSRMGDQKKKVIQEFLSDLLSGKYDADTIQAVWNSTSADFFIRGNEGLIAFLKLIQDRIQQMRDMSA
jgi:hypothetical protein